ncbi:MAG: acyl-CoA dehydrogenase family protein [candidate division WOR-3 bacterium]
MDYFLSDDEREIKALARDFAERYLMPRRRELDERHEYPRDILEEMARLDFFRILIPEEYGGFGDKIMYTVLVIEELSRAEAGTAIAFGANGLGTTPIIVAGTEEQKRKYLPPVAEGKKYAAFALTEPDAGSDAGSVKTRAVKKGDRYILNGTKRFITNAGEADIMTVVASTDPTRGARGLSIFIVEKDYPGVSFGKVEETLGIRASVKREIYFEDCEVPEENLLGGKEGLGFIHVARTFDRTRPAVGAQALGIAQGAFEEALKYARERKQFGQPIASFQAIQIMLADMATKIEASRALLYSIARYIDSGAKEVGHLSAMAKYFPADVAMEVTVDAVQIFGGYGYTTEYIVEKYMRDAKITQIYEGTNQIQRLLLAAHLVRKGQL